MNPTQSNNTESLQGKLTIAILPTTKKDIENNYWYSLRRIIRIKSHSKIVFLFMGQIRFKHALVKLVSEPIVYVELLSSTRNNFLSPEKSVTVVQHFYI